MTNPQEDSSGRTTTGNSDTAVESAPGVRPVWRCPNLTIIDIRRTMFALGSILDGLTGSI